MFSVVIAGGSRLGLRRDGSRSPLPLDVHDSFNSRDLHNSMRSTGALRRHETDRHGIFFCCSTAIPAAGSGAAKDYRIVGVFVETRAKRFQCIINVKGSGELSFRIQQSCDRSWPWNRRNISKRETQLAIVHYVHYDSYLNIQI